MRLLLVKDSLRLQELLADPLRRAGYGLDAVGTVAELLSSVAVVQYDLIIVDLGLPDGDGLTAIRSLRSMRHSTPILIITARGSVEDRVIGLDSGVDDYLIKPFNHAELLALRLPCRGSLQQACVSRDCLTQKHFGRLALTGR